MAAATIFDKLSNFVKIISAHISPPSIAGLEITADAVNLCEVIRNSRNRELWVNNYATEPLPPNAVANKKIQHPNAVKQAIYNIVDTVKLQNNYVCIAIPDAEATIHTIEFDNSLSNKEIDNEILLEADRYSPYNSSDVTIDYNILHSASLSSESTDSKVTKVLFTAAKTESIIARLQLINATGLEVKIVDIESLATGRAIAFMLQQLAATTMVSDIIGFINIDNSTISLHIFYHQQYNYKIKFSTEYTRNKQFADHQVISKLAQDFFATAGLNNRINYLFIAGTASNEMVQLQPLIKRKFNTTTLIAAPFNNMQLLPHINRQQFARAASGLTKCCGLALRGLAGP